MKEESIVITYEDSTVIECGSAIIVPERALTEAGFIKTMTKNSTAQSKHEFHAMSQIVRSQFEDGEMDIEILSGPLTIQWKNENETLTSGIVIYIDLQGKFHLIGNSGENTKKMLQSAHRYCTRWVRLDI